MPHYKRYHQARFFRSDGESPDSRVEAICYEENAHHRQLVELLNGLVFVDPGHGLAHAHRVATLCMAFYTLCEPDGEDAIRYYLMGFLHDLGRLSGGPEPEHGQRSVEAIRRLGVALSPPQLEAIRTHTTQREAQTLAEQCLFDADRLDLRRFGKELQPSLLSPALAGGLADFAPLADLFVRQRHCCFVPPNIRNRAAMRWLIYLHRHLDYLRPKRLFHGSLTPGIRQLRSPPMSYPIDGNCLFATPDPAEAAFIVWKWREPSRDTVSIYELPATGYREIEFNFLGIEFVFGEPVVPLGEYRVPFDPDRDPVTRYRQFRLPERWVDSPAGG